MSVWWHVPEGQVIMEAGFPAQHWVLQFIADFSGVQSNIEMVLDRKLALETPAVAKVINKKFLRRLTDEDRWSLVKALAVDCDYDGDLRAASTAFWRCKRVRDLFAHRSDLPLVRTPSSPDYFYLITGSEAPDGLPDPLTPAALRQLSADCRWLSALVSHLASRSGVKFASFLVRERSDGFRYLPSIECLAPPPLPVPLDWDSTGLTRETGESDIPVKQD